MSKLPVVSIGIASYNNASYIEELLESVRCQTYPAIELVVVDDCSPDNSVEIIEQWSRQTGYPVKLLRHERNQGITRTFSDCRRLCTGMYISLVGSDDLLHPQMIELTVAEFERQGESCGAVYSDCRVIDSQGKALSDSFLKFFDPKFASRPPEGNLIVPLLTGFYLPALTTTVRRSAIDKAGPYDETLFSEDLDMWLRLSRVTNFVYLPNNLGAYRVHNASAIHANKLALNETYFRIYRKGYFEGSQEWAAARLSLADHAEHYYADNGMKRTAYLWYAWNQTRRAKILLFCIMSCLNIDYKTVMGFLRKK